MGQQSLATVLGQLRRLIGGKPIDDASDGQLLEQFVVRRDQSAFAALMQRHGPMVLGTCRRMLPGSHDAEDAYQATFVVLARRAGSLYREGSLAGWLHAVASRIALKARASSARRSEREQPGAGTPEAAMPSRIDPFLQAADREAKWLLDEELNQLPDKYRAPMVLCYLEGKTSEEAAQELGCPLGSMSWKLDKGRELLKQRLARRGVTVGAGALTGLLAEQAATAAVPIALFETTHQAIGLVMAGQSGAGLLSAQALTLADGVLQAMVWAKIKLAAACVLTVCLLGTGAGVWAYTAQPPEPPATIPPTPELALIERVSQPVADWQPTEDERRFDQIGWSRSVVEGQLLASQHGRPMFLVTHAGDMGLGRSCGGSHAMRGGALSNPEIIALLNQYFVPVYVSNQPAGTGSERDERRRIYQDALKANLNAGSNTVYIVAPDGRVLDAGHGCHLVDVDTLLDFLCQNLADAQAGGGPILEPQAQSAPPAAPTGSLVLHLTSRYLKQQGPARVPIRVPLGQRRNYDWKAYPAEDWLVWSPVESARLLPARPLALGDSWDVDSELIRALYLRCYPPSEDNNLARNQIEEQALTATVISIKGDLAWARLDGRLKMTHPFYPGKDEPRLVTATVTGFLEFEPATKRIRNLQLTTPTATYGKDLFGVAVRSQ